MRWLSPAVEQLEGLARSAAEAPRQVANAHTIFNVINTFLFIGFTTQIARLVEWLVPDRPLSDEERLEPRFLDEALISTPAVALENARLEVDRLGEYVLSMVQQVLPTAVSGSRHDLDVLSLMDKAADRMHRAILGYLGKISSGSLSQEQAQRLMQLVEVANDLEHIGDRVATDIVTSANKRLDERSPISKPAITAITSVHQQVAKALEDALSAFRTRDTARATSVRKMKREVSSMAHSIACERINHLAADPSNHLMSYVREVELLEILDGIFKIARRIARSQLAISTTKEE